ncbi:PepSY domain-containing protein [Nonomuraea sp. NPDC052129]|uniref:PepSY domain-containing protein n=1 Tax=Nonomuraea sp. NPDC052129 TaxID=3154651 RepID=UPI00343AC8C0
MTKTIIGGALAGAALLTATACGGDARQMTEPFGAPPTPYVATGSPMNPGDAQADPQKRSAVKKLEEVGQAATKAVPGSTLVSMETEENGGLWEVQVVDDKGVEHQMDVESGTAKVVSGPRAEDDENAGDKARYLDRLKAAKLDYAQAAAKVLAAVPGGRITEINLDSHRDKIVWEVDVVPPNGSKQDMTVDATDGAVTKDSHSD